MTTPVIPGDLIARTQVIGGLRQLADWLDAHPDVPVSPFGWDVHVYPSYSASEAERRAEVDRIAAILGVPVRDDTADAGHYTATRVFGRVAYEAVCVPDQRRAAHRALMSYDGAITPDHANVEAATR